MATIKEEVIVDVEIEEGDAISRMERLKGSLVNLKQEQAKLNKDFKDGNITLKEYSEESVRVENLTRKSQATYNNLSKEVTGNKSALDKLIVSNNNLSQSVDRIIPGMGSFVSGMKGMITQSLAFIATPIGAVIAALGIAIAALTQYFRDNEEGQNQFNKIMNIGAAIMGKLTDAVSLLGKFLIDNLLKGFEAVGNFLFKMIPGLRELTDAATEFLGIDTANKISDLQAATDVLERQLIVRKAELEVLIAQKKLLAEDKNLNPRERALALQEAIDAQMEINKLDRQFAANKYEIIRLTNTQSNSNKEALKAEAEAKAELIRVDKETADKLKELTVKQQALNKESADAVRLKQEEAAAEREIIDALERRQQLEIENLEIRKGITQENKDLETEFQEFLVEDYNFRIDLQTGLDEANRQFNDRDVMHKKKAIQIKQMLDQNYVNSLSATLGQGAALFAKNTFAHKVLASAQAIIDTYRGATLALATYPPPFGAIAAGFTVAAGLANVAKINAVQFAKGGVIGGKLHPQGGTRFFGTDGSVFEAERGENMYVLNRNASKAINALSAVNEAHGGVSLSHRSSRLAFGGLVETQQASAAASAGDRQNRMLTRMIQNIPAPVVGLVDFAEENQKLVQVQDRANVL